MREFMHIQRCEACLCLSPHCDDELVFGRLSSSQQKYLLPTWSLDADVNIQGHFRPGGRLLCYSIYPEG